jgi:hypothetical protein
MKPNDESSLLACDACGSCHKTGVIIRGEYYYTVCDTCMEQSDSLVAAKIARRKDEEIAKLKAKIQRMSKCFYFWEQYTGDLR